VRILDVRQVKAADQIVLSARCKVRRIGQDDLVFKIPANFEEFVCADASPFAAALLLPCMKLGEDLVVQGSISERLHSGMKEIIRIVADWDIGLKPISVVADELVPDAVNTGASGTFFSGGVDSFYTFLSHQNDSYPLTHLLLVNGFDIDPKNPGLWNATTAHIRALAAEAGTTLVELETNVRSLTDPILSWVYCFGGCMAAAALCLRRGLARVYIPSSLDTANLLPVGSHPDIDHLWSAEALTFRHDGAEVTRAGKVDREIAKSPLALKHLRVCIANASGEYNCGRCLKCLMTMVNLFAAGALDRAETFPNHIDAAVVGELKCKASSTQILWRENLQALQAHDLAPDLQKAIQATLASYFDGNEPKLRRAIRRIDYLDHSYAHGSLRKLKARFTGKTF
jgi:hypothetical protein